MGDRARIKFNVEWFYQHSDYWTELSSDCSELQTGVADIVIPAGTLDWPGLATFKAKYTETAQKIHELYGDGAEQTEETGTLLETSGQAYARTESSNAAEADAILAELAEERG